MSLPVTSLNGVKVYNLSAGRTLPQWLEESKKKKISLRYNQDFRARVELIQDFSFPAASYRLKSSPDGKYLIASGTYPPQIKVFELDQLSMKCERHLDGEVTQIEVLSEDFSKLALLRTDRTLEFHAKFGAYHRTRLPKICRDMAYHAPSCDLFIGGSTPIAYRVNLHLGQHLAPLETSLPSVNAVKCNPVHHLLAFGGEGSAVEFWDPRDHTRAAYLQLASSLSQSNQALSRSLLNCEISSLEYDTDGLTIAVGTSTGHVLLYDLRSPIPLQIKDHKYQQPIRDIKFHPTSRKIISSDTKIIKLWDRDSGEAFSSIQPEADINSLCSFGSTGMIMAAVEQHRIQAFYVPSLGPAPKWCSFLDNMTEELEESKIGSTIYEDYKFVTRDELEQLNLTDLIGSNLLRPYMHGFFMDIRLYNKVKAAADPYAFETYVQDKIKKKIEEKRANRIVVQKRLPKVNPEFAKVLLSEKKTQAAIRSASSAEVNNNNNGKGASEILANPLMDSRFAKLFSDEGFAIDTSSADFRRLHPSNESDPSFATRFRRVDDDEEVDEDEEVDDDEDDIDENELEDGMDNHETQVDSDDDLPSSAKNRMGMVRDLEASRAASEHQKQRDMWIRAEKKLAEKESSNFHKRKQPAMFELKAGFGLPGSQDRNNRPKTNLSFEELERKSKQHSSSIGSLSISELSSLPTKDSMAQRRDRRGMQSIYGSTDDEKHGSGQFRGKKKESFRRRR